MLHRSRIFALLLLVFLVAVCYFIFSPQNLNFELYLIAALLGLFFFFKVKFLRYLFLIFIFIFLAGWRVQKSLPVFAKKDLSYFKGLIIQEPQTIGRAQYLIVKSDEGYRVNVITSAFPKYEYGERILVSGKITPVSVLNNYQERRGFYLKEGISYSSYFPEIKIENRDKAEPFKLPFGMAIIKKLISAKNFFNEKIGQILPEPEAGLLSGIILGTRAELDTNLKELLIRVGLIHIIALSGYNITIIADSLKKITKFLTPRLAFFISLLGIWSFVVATGASSSILRAAIMGTMLILAKNLGRKTDSLVAIIFALFLMVFANPFSLVYDIGLQLSFVAVLGIILITPHLEKVFNFLGGILNETISATLGAQIATFPLISFYFGRVSLVSLLANILVLPFIPMIMFLGFLATIIGFLSVSVAKILALIPWVLLRLVSLVAETLGSFSWAAVDLKFSLVSLLAVYFIYFEIFLIVKRLSGKRSQIEKA